MVKLVWVDGWQIRGIPWPWYGMVCRGCGSLFRQSWGVWRQIDGPGFQPPHDYQPCCNNNQRPWKRRKWHWKDKAKKPFLFIFISKEPNIIVRYNLKSYGIYIHSFHLSTFDLCYNFLILPNLINLGGDPMNPWKEHNRPFPRHKNQFLPRESFEASFYLRWKANSEFFKEYSQQLIETDRIKFY